MATKFLQRRSKVMKKKISTAAPTTIVVCGLDGSGKTTTITNLVNYLESQGFSVKRFRSPYLAETLDLLKLTGDGKPWKDNFADTFVFALDNIILASEYAKWLRMNYDYLVSQRGIGGFYEHSAVRGFSYAQSNRIQAIANSLVSPAELQRWREEETYISNFFPLMEKAREIYKYGLKIESSKVAPFVHCNIRAHFNADPKIAYSRICDDPLGDKFETPSYMKRQYEETLKLHRALVSEEPELESFAEEIQLYLDTTNLTLEEAFKKFLRQLRKIGAIQ